MPNQSYFYFAWVNSYETGFNGSHIREDELIFSFELKHEEGQFAELELEVGNPHVGLLAAGRKLWAWFSWWDGAVGRPLFFGRLVGIPDDLFEDIIKIKLVARPLNYAAQRQALADSLKVLPYYDPVFIDTSKLDDPDVVLEGYSALYHCDRLTHQVTISDIINGEDGYAVFGSGDAFYEGVSVKIAGAPLLVCEVNAEVSWTQCDHTGVYEMKTLPNIDTSTATTTSSQTQTTYTGFTSIKVGPSIGDGFHLFDEPDPRDTEQQETHRWEKKNVTPGPHKDGDLMEESGTDTYPNYGGQIVNSSKSEQAADPETGQGEEYSYSETRKYTYNSRPPATPKGGSGGGGGGDGGDSGGGNAADAATTTHEVAVEVEQDRAETISVAMRADVQPILVDVTEDQDDLSETLKLNARDLVEAGVVSTHDGTYFPTERGQQSIEYLLMVARAHLLAGSRVVAVEWECRMANIVGLSCRMNAVLYDDRLPGGVAVGKVVAYEMTCSGDDGEMLGKVTINSSVGNGTPLLREARSPSVGAQSIVVLGTPSYVAEGYVAPGYQYYVGQMVSTTTGDVTFSPVEFQANGLQLPITEDQILVRHEYHDGLEQPGVMEALELVANQLASFEFPPIGTQITGPTQSMMDYSNLVMSANQMIANIYAANPSWVEMEFKPTTGLYVSSQYTTDVSQLTLPKQIDLSAT